MMALLEFEQERRKSQSDLESTQKADERNRLGQYATPYPLALEILQLAYEYWEGRGDKIHFLEPGFGTGPFSAALLEVFQESRLGSVAGVELDPRVMEVARKIKDTANIDLIKGDFTTLSPSIFSHRPNLIVCNPPYVRHHHLKKKQKQELQKTVKKRLGITISGLAGLYCYFLLLSHDWLSNDGIGIWLIPTEFMDVNYGKAIRDYLTKHVTLLRLHRFETSDVQFDDALVSSAVVVFQKKAPPKGHKVTFTVGGTLAKPQTRKMISIEDLTKNGKWTKVHQAIQYYSVDTLRHITLGDLFKTRRGIATGANNFFIRTREEAQALNLPERFLRPILPSPRYLKSNVVETNHDGFPNLSPQLVLIDCKLPEDRVRSEYPKLWDFFKSGKALGIHERYLASKRSPWYRQEDVSPSPFLCTYMGRSDGKLVPFRFIWNQSKAIAPNVYLMLYPLDHLAMLLQNNLDRQKQVFELLQQIDTESMIDEGRTYGGGLHKIEPKELYNVRLTNIPIAQELVSASMLL